MSSRRKPRNAYHQCTERFTCIDDVGLAVFHCPECEKYLCETCHKQTHSSMTRLSDHQVKRLPEVEKDRLCWTVTSDSSHRCLADFYCKECSHGYCVTCDHQLHRALSRKDHSRVEFDKVWSTRKRMERERDTSRLKGNSLDDASNVIPEPSSKTSPSKSTQGNANKANQLSPRHRSSNSRPSDLAPSLQSKISATDKPPSGVKSSSDLAPSLQSKISATDKPPSGVKSSSDRASVRKSSSNEMFDLDIDHFTKQTSSIPSSSDPRRFNGVSSVSLSAELQSLLDEELSAGTPVTNHKEPIRPKVPGGESRTQNDLPSNTSSHQATSEARVSKTTHSKEVNGPDRPTVPCRCLVDENDVFLGRNEETFLRSLGCSISTPVRVVAFFGHSGDGRSHALNWTFFNGMEVFATSSRQEACTRGLWMAHDAARGLLLVDTEGFAGCTAPCEPSARRARLLLKAIAVSDLAVCLSRAERLHDDLVAFLSEASTVYERHLRGVMGKGACKPAVLVFHETRHTEPLGEGEESEGLLNNLFERRGFPPSSFQMSYTGTRTQPSQSTDFQALLNTVEGMLQLRDGPKRPMRSVLTALSALNDRFGSPPLIDPSSKTPSGGCLNCVTTCLACGARCQKTFDHEKRDGVLEHSTSAHCRYAEQHYNKVYKCSLCREVVVFKAAEASDSAFFAVTKFVVSGYILECPGCGVIYRSRHFLRSNPNPEESSAIRVEVWHVWPGEMAGLQGSHNAAQLVLDSVSSAAGAVSDICAGPSRMVSDFVMDGVAPSYWVPNSLLVNCEVCELNFEQSGATKHHCRACGQGVCAGCSRRELPVSERGWGSTPVRVCDRCYSEREGVPDPASEDDFEPAPVGARQWTETVKGAAEIISTAVSISKDFVKDCARPAYWVPDTELIACWICKVEFGPLLAKHHCRSCGRGVCEICSPGRTAVPRRGWDLPVRVCNRCIVKT